MTFRFQKITLTAELLGKQDGREKCSEVFFPTAQARIEE